MIKATANIFVISMTDKTTNSNIMFTTTN